MNNKKPLTEPTELRLLTLLHTRMTLTEKQKQHLINLQKGHEGEIHFQALTESLQCEGIILHDLLLKVSNSIFQLDSLILTAEAIHLFEVKNFEGDYYYDSDKLYNRNKSELNNPLHQLNRSESMLRQLLHSLGCTKTINASVVFINPQFTLYQAPLNKPFIYPTQLSKHIKKLNAISPKLDRSGKLLAEQLLSLHLKESPFKLIPPYTFEQLKKGITCTKCNSYSIIVENKYCICRE